MTPLRSFRLVPVSAVVLIASCGSGNGNGFSLDGGGGGGRDGSLIPPNGDGGPKLTGADSGGGEGGVTVGGPTTCAQAAASKSYIGCDYWPTVTVNPVWSVFDFAAVVANTQSAPAIVTVTGPNNVNLTGANSITVAPNSLQKIYLPWVPALKGQDSDECGSTPAFTASVMVRNAAYHLQSSVPVTVYQFNALEYKGEGGPPGKDWSQCPGTAQTCAEDLSPIGCYSFTNDASVLLPSTAMTGNYRVTGESSFYETDGMGDTFGEGDYFVVTATQDNTNVTATISSTGQVVAGNGIAATSGGGILRFSLNAGDVAEVLGAAQTGVDLSGSLVQADHPIQVLTGIQCADQPLPMPPTYASPPACDHLESSVLPEETLGTDYVVTVPTSPNNVVVGHVVRFFGNVDGTTLTYSPSQPPGCPSTLNAGQVATCAGTAGACSYTTYNTFGMPNPPTTFPCVNQSFEVTGNHEFAVSSFMLGGSVVDGNAMPGMQEGDPSMSPMVATEQYRTRYIFLAPSDYDQSYADVVAPPGTTLTLDGVAVAAASTPLNASWSVVRVTLGAGQNGAHVMSGTRAFGIQVIGYGLYTSYQYPAGLDLAEIAPPPPPPPP